MAVPLMNYLCGGSLEEGYAKSLYYRRSDALLMDLQASHYLDEEEEDRPCFAHQPQQSRHPNASPRSSRNHHLLRPIPRRPVPFRAPEFIQAENYYDSGYSTSNSSRGAEDCSLWSEDDPSIASSLEELRQEGARNPLRDDQDVLLSDSTQLFLCKNCTYYTTTDTNKNTTRFMELIIKPVAMRANDLTSQQRRVL